MLKKCFFLGKPLKFKNDVFIYPPTLNEAIGDDDGASFAEYQTILLLSRTELDDLYAEHKIDQSYDPFDFLMKNCRESSEFYDAMKEALAFFTKTTATVVEDSNVIFLGDISQAILSGATIDELDKFCYLNKDNFFEFQNLLRESIGTAPVDPSIDDEDERVVKMKCKVRKRKQIIAQKSGISFSTMIAAVCCMNPGITPLNIGEMSMASINRLFELGQKREEFNINVKVAMFDANVKPKYWISDK